MIFVFEVHLRAPHSAARGPTEGSTPQDAAAEDATPQDAAAEDATPQDATTGPYSVEDYAKAWVEASEIIQRATGARGTRLHRKLDDPHVLLAIARWDSKASRDAAEAQRDPRVQAIFAEQARYVEIRVVGAFDEADWVVPPGSAQD